jgi:hypothetical protein
MKTKGWLAAFWMAQVVGCGGSSPSSGSAGNPPPSFGGTWACNVAMVDHFGTLTRDGEAVEIDPFQTPEGSMFYVSAQFPWDLTSWFCSPFAIQAGTANLYELPECKGTLTITRGQLVVSADSSAMTIGEVGTDSGTDETLAGKCVRTGPPPPPSTSSGSSSSGGSSGGRAPECNSDSDCGDCAQCSSGQCYTCPVGSLGICTC